MTDDFPDYFEAGTRISSAEEKADPTMKVFHTCDRDIVYEGLRIDMVLSYMAATKKKDAQGDGQKIYSYTHMRKINDAILFGARTVNEILSSSYYSEMDSFLTKFKKETADTRSRGKMDEKSADPISFSLFRLILTWAIERGNILCEGVDHSTMEPDGEIHAYPSTLWLYTIFPYLTISS